jgi:uncharacterized protein with PhoU and TrkA domain
MSSSFLDFSGQAMGLDVTMGQLPVGQDRSLVPRRLKDLLPYESRLIVLAIRKPDGSTAFKPAPETDIAAGDVLIVMGEQPALRQMETILAASARIT